MNKVNNKILSTILTSLPSCGATFDELEATIALNFSILNLPDEKEIVKTAQNIEQYQDTILYIKEVDLTGNTIDEYNSDQLYVEDKTNIVDELLRLARLIRLMQATDDRNHTKLYSQIAQLVASTHSGFVSEDDYVYLPGPLGCMVSEDTYDKLWNKFNSVKQDLEESISPKVITNEQ